MVRMLCVSCCVVSTRVRRVHGVCYRSLLSKGIFLQTMPLNPPHNVKGRVFLNRPLAVERGFLCQNETPNPPHNVNGRVCTRVFFSYLHIDIELYLFCLANDKKKVSVFCIENTSFILK